jgi:hypothetical protein
MVVDESLRRRPGRWQKLSEPTSRVIARLNEEPRPLPASWRLIGSIRAPKRRHRAWWRRLCRKLGRAMMA